MRQVFVYNSSRALDQPVRARYCESFACQLRGLMFRRRLAPGEALLLVQSCDSRSDAAIHMLFVWIDLAVIWINAAGVVVDARLARRWRPVYIPQAPARFVLESAPERLEDFRVGEKVVIELISI